MSGIGHNSKDFDEGVMEIITEYSESLERSAVENDIRKELREKAEDKYGLDRKALQNGISRIKSSLSEQEGYDESMQAIKRIADDMGGAESIFSWYVEKQEERQKARDEAKAAKAKEKRDKQKEAAKQKEKDEEYKPAPERKPKPVIGKDAASGEKEDASIGEQQAEAFKKGQAA